MGLLSSMKGTVHCHAASQCCSTLPRPVFVVKVNVQSDPWSRAVAPCQWSCRCLWFRPAKPFRVCRVRFWRPQLLYQIAVYLMCFVQNRSALRALLARRCRRLNAGTMRCSYVALQSMQPVQQHEMSLLSATGNLWTCALCATVDQYALPPLSRQASQYFHATHVECRMTSLADRVRSRVSAVLLDGKCSCAIRHVEKKHQQKLTMFQSRSDAGFVNPVR